MILKPALGINIKDHSPEILEGRIWRPSEKIDGVRRLFYKNQTGRVSCYSRTGKPDRWLDHITGYLEAPWFPDDMVYDCELVDKKLYYDRVDSFILRAETTGKANQQYYTNKKDLMAICFDMVQPGGDDRTGEERHEDLIRIFNDERQDEPMIKVPTYDNIVGADMERINELMRQITEQNGEGIMLMAMDSIYIPGRSKNLIKVKRMEEFIGEVIGVELAKDDTKIAGGIAALICKVNGCTVPVRVGSGFNTEERQIWMTNDAIGMQIEIDAFGKTRNKNGDISLSMPIYKDIIPFR